MEERIVATLTHIVEQNFSAEELLELFKQLHSYWLASIYWRIEAPHQPNLLFTKKTSVISVVQSLSPFQNLPMEELYNICFVPLCPNGANNQICTSCLMTTDKIKSFTIEFQNCHLKMTEEPISYFYEEPEDHQHRCTLKHITIDINQYLKLNIDERELLLTLFHPFQEMSNFTDLPHFYVL